MSNHLFSENLDSLSIEDVKTLLAHRYPFLFVDKVVDIDLKNNTVTGLKSVTYNEPYFTGHFPHISIMPGVIITEATAQVAGILMILKEKKKSEFLLAKVDEARFIAPVTPGHQIKMIAKIIKSSSRIIKFYTKVLIEDKLHAEIYLTLSRYESAKN